MITTAFAMLPVHGYTSGTLIYSDKYISDGYSIERRNDTNSMYLMEYIKKFRIEYKENGELNNIVESEMKLKRLGKYEGGFFFYIKLCKTQCSEVRRRCDVSDH